MWILLVCHHAVCCVAECVYTGVYSSTRPCWQGHIEAFDFDVSHQICLICIHGLIVSNLLWWCVRAYTVDVLKCDASDGFLQQQAQSQRLEISCLMWCLGYSYHTHTHTHTHTKQQQQQTNTIIIYRWVKLQIHVRGTAWQHFVVAKIVWYFWR